jgi:hypothetical protein
MISLTRRALLAIFAVLLLSAPFSARADEEGGGETPPEEPTATEAAPTDETLAPPPTTEGGEGDKKDEPAPASTPAPALAPAPAPALEEECSLGNSETEKGIVQPDGTCKSSAKSHSLSAILGICTAGFLILSKVY